jgi:aspartate/methionine/tyrosine aminotransferase
MQPHVGAVSQSVRIGRIARELPRVTANRLTDAISALRVQGKEVVSLSGTPYWAPPDHVLEAAAQAARSEGNAPSKGFPELRWSLAAKLEAEGIPTDPETEILITNGAMHALSLVFSTLLDAGNEVLLYKPSFFFFGMIRLAGGVPVYAETTQQAGWRWDATALARCVTSRTRAIVINSPTNPTGYTANEHDLNAVGEIARRHNLWIVSDESYDNMVFDGLPFLRMAAVRKFADRTITICSFTKTFVMQPWRMGFITGPREVMEAVQRVMEWNVLRCCHVAQRAAQAAVEGPREWMLEIARRFQHSRDLMVRGLAGASKLSFTVPSGGPFLFVNVSRTGLTGEEFSSRLLNRYFVAADPGEFFESGDHIRLPFGGPDDLVIEVARRLTAASADQSAN